MDIAHQRTFGGDGSGAAECRLMNWQVVVLDVPVAEAGRKPEQLHVLAYNDDGPYGNQNRSSSLRSSLATHMKLPPKLGPKLESSGWGSA